MKLGALDAIENKYGGFFYDLFFAPHASIKPPTISNLASFFPHWNVECQPIEIFPSMGSDTLDGSVGKSISSAHIEPKHFF